MNIVERIAASKFIATGANVEDLAREHTVARNAADKTGSTYLAILIACTQQRVSGRGRRKSPTDALEAIHKELYPFVVKGVSDAAGSAKEVNRRTTFARTSKADLAAYLRAGKPLEDLVPGETSKRQLRAALAEPRSENRTVRILNASKQSILSAVDRESRRDLIAAKRNLERLIDDLVKKLDELAEGDDVKVTNQMLRREPPRIHHHA